MTAPRIGGDSSAPPPKQYTNEPIDASTQIIPQNELSRYEPVESFNADSSNLPKQPVETYNEYEDLPVIDATEPKTYSFTSSDPADQPISTKPAIAILPFILTDTIPDRNAGVVLAKLLEQHIDLKRFDLCERSDLSRLMTERRFQNMDTVTRAAAIGRMRGVRYLVLGDVMWLGSQYHLAIRMVDCGSSRISRRALVEFASLREAPGRMVEVAHQLKFSERDTGSSIDVANVIGGISDLFDQVNPDADFRLSISTASDKSIYWKGENIRFIVETNRDCYLTLISQDNDSKPTLLFPNRWSGSSFVQANRPVTIPHEDANFKFYIKPPYGPTRVKAIATIRKPLMLANVTAKSIEQSDFQDLDSNTRIGFKGIGVAPEQGDLGQWISQSVEGAANWATAELTVMTVESKPSAPPVDDHITSQGVDIQQQTQPLNIGPEPTDANECILKRWRQLTNTHLPPSADLLQPENVHANEQSTQLLVFHKNATGAKGLGGNMVVIDLPDVATKGINNQSIQIDEYPDAVAVVPNLKLTPYALPSTRPVSIQWPLHNTFSAGNDINCEKVFDQTRHITTPLIGVIDSGFDFDDPRLAHAAWTNPGEIPNNGKDDDSNGLIDDIHGYNFSADTAKLYDPISRYSHGTFVSSIIAAKPASLDTDIIGIAPHARIIPAIALASKAGSNNSHAVGDLVSIIRALNYVVNQGAAVINLSFGRSVSPVTLAEINRIPLWDELDQRGVILICAAGNNYSNNDIQPIFPASLPRSNVISVLATDVAGRLGRVYNPASSQWSTFSNYGKSSVHIAAPGTLILGIHRREDATLLSGTSYSAAYVTAAVALVRAEHPDWNHRTVIRAILETAQSKSTLNDKCMTGGLLDLAAALRWLPSDSIQR